VVFILNHFAQGYVFKRDCQKNEMTRTRQGELLADLHPSGNGPKTRKSLPMSTAGPKIVTRTRRSVGGNAKDDPQITGSAKAKLLVSSKGLRRVEANGVHSDM